MRVMALCLMILVFISGSLQSIGLKRSWTMSGSDAVTAIAYDPTGERLMVGRLSGIIWRCDVHQDSSDDWSNDDSENLAAHFSRVNCIVFSKDGKLMASCANDNTVKIWGNAPKYDKLLHSYSTTVHPQHLSFNSNESQLLAVCETGQMLLWEIKTGTVLKTWNLFSTSYAAYFYDESNIIVSLYNISGDILIIDSLTGLTTKTVGAHAYGISSMAIDKDRKLVLSTGYDGTIKIWTYDLSLISTIHTYSSVINWVGYSADGCKIISGDSAGALEIYDSTTKRSLDGMSGSSSCNTLSVHPRGSFFAVGYNNGMLGIYEY